MREKQAEHPDVPLSAEDYTRQLEFGKLLAELSKRFITLPVAEIDDQIENAQKKVCDFLGFDLSAVWQWEDNQPEFLLMTHLYRPLGGPPVPERFEAAEVHPWALGEIRSGRKIVIDDTEIIPVGAEQDREVWRHYGIKSALAIPLNSAVGLPYGAVSFNDMRGTRQWTPDLIHQLEFVAVIFSNALIRKQLEQEMRYSNAKLELAANSAGAGIWSLNLNTKVFWVTRIGRELFGFNPDDTITFEHFLSLVHPEDRRPVVDVIQKLADSEEILAVEYRITKPDGQQCWMASRGRKRCKVPGESSCVVMGVTVDVTQRKRKEEQLQQALEEVQALKDQLNEENIYLRTQLKRDDGLDGIIGEHESVVGMIQKAKQVAATDATVMIAGETGTGKELLAQAIHDLSSRGARTMVRVNCAALPSSLIEGELFGREKGAYTGAVTRQVGRFEIADNSTIFLDEIGELPLELQAKLLHVLQNGCFERLGSYESITTDVRVITATNRDLLKMVANGTFREDLYHRLNVFPIEVPPLRERATDIPLLIWKIVEEFNTRMGRSITTIPEKAIARMQTYEWPGNIRELRNVVERAMILSTGSVLKIDMATKATQTALNLQTLEEVEREHITSVLERTQWRISGAGGAADVLGMVPTTLHSRMKKLEIVRPIASV